MQARSLIVAAAASVTLLGCASITNTMPTFDVSAGTRLNCRGGDQDAAHCIVVVSLNAGAICDMLRCKPVVDAEEVHVRNTGSSLGNSIMWILATPGYEFDGTGIAFPNGSGFNCQSTGPKRVSCTNDGSSPKTKYSVKVKGRDALDPYVFND